MADVDVDDVVLAESTRSRYRENAYRGHAVIVDADGALAQAWGDPEVVILPRSAHKPAQAAALVRCGLPVEGPLLALAAASHSGEPHHLAGVAAILEQAGLSIDALQTPPDLPYGPQAREAWLASGRGPERIAMNCSGKHAAMLLTCVVRGWDTSTYLDPEHPLQAAIRDRIADFADEQPGEATIDGCGAPLLPLSLVGLARCVGRIVAAPHGSPERQVADAMRAHPEYVGGTQSPTTHLMRGVPGLLAKEGADGVWVAALPDGSALAVKITDGADRPRVPVVVSLLRRMGRSDGVLAELAEGPVLGGGRPVGVVRAVI